MVGAFDDEPALKLAVAGFAGGNPVDEPQRGADV